LKGICGIGDDIATAIINNQPYKDFNDFLSKMDTYKNAEKENKFGESAVITLIKAGCFDRLLNKNRIGIMKDYIRSISKPLNSLGVENIQTLYELGLLTKEQIEYEYRLYRFRKYVCSKKFFVKQVGKSPNTAYYKLENQYSEPYFFEHFESNMIENKDYEYDEDGFIIVKRGSLDREFDKLIKNFKDSVLSSTKYLEAVNENRFNNLWNEKVEGNISKWEMDSLSFYYHDHELAHVKKDDYGIISFDELPEIPVVTEHYVYRGTTKPRFRLSRICGTVLDKDKNKHIITLLTPDGVVSVKFYKGQFGFYDKQISEMNEEGSGKTVLEKSWFGRGNKLLVTGYRRGDQFVPKKYSDSAFRHTLQLIKEIDEEANLKLQSDRVGEDDE
jgi:DNA polymerase-3 subunit alpha